MKRDGSQQEVKFDSITRRLQPLCEGGSGYSHTMWAPQKIAVFREIQVGEMLYFGQNGCKMG